MLFESPPECLAARTCQVLCNVGLQIMTQPVGTKEVLFTPSETEATNFRCSKTKK